jgi:hypothetical protein
VSALRCSSCGNKTRFDVFENKQVRVFHHYSLGGDLTIEEEETLSKTLTKVVCRWCGSTDVVEYEPPAGLAGER